jgi:hypothetical protein
MEGKIQPRLINSSAPPFLLTHLIVLVLFVAPTIATAKKFCAEPGHTA